MTDTPVQRAIRARLDRPPAVSKRGLAKQIGVKPDRLIAWERGSLPHDYQLVKMAPHLDVSVEDLRGPATSPATGELPDDLVDVLRRLASIGKLVPALEAINDGAPDLIKVLQDAAHVARRLNV